MLRILLQNVLEIEPAITLLLHTRNLVIFTSTSSSLPPLLFLLLGALKEPFSPPPLCTIQGSHLAGFVDPTMIDAGAGTWVD